MNIPQDSIQKIMEGAVLIQKHCKESCFDFQVMTSRFHKDTLILRWVEVDISDVERPIQCYRYRCYHLDGSAQNCSIHYNNVQEANTFFKSLETHFRQDFVKK
ncbi:hypothetical protein ACFO3O_06365 [Dokdonia ponticola]|uniref:Uncharacterized protein n=1 Tax=Dokdonia ponticola TaxID=2041041 RepID=A0ABV9HUG9_9FLAO